MYRLNHRTLIDRGRKAGLKTWELYPALAGQAPERQGKTDGNGFASEYDAQGHLIYRRDEVHRGR